MNNKALFIILFINLFLFFNCKKATNENNTAKENIEVKEKNNLNFDSILKCSEYSFNETYFFTADYGCIYNPKGENKFGNIIIYLVPKNKFNYDENQIELETKKLNNSNSEEIKKNYEIFVFLVPKEYLNYNPNGDPIYYQKEKYKEELYGFDSNQNIWKLLDQINITSKSENPKEQEWRENHITSNKKVNTDFTIPKGFYVLDSAVIDLEAKKFKILALESDKEKNNKANWHFGLPIVILDNENHSVIQNNDLVFKFNDNCPADGFDGIVTKNNFFTIQQISCLDFMYVNSYITFKIDKSTNKIFLHKYSEEYTDRSNPNKAIPTKIWSTKDFGVIEFKDVKDYFLKNLQ